MSEEEKFGLTDELWLTFVKELFAGYEQKLQLTELEKKAVPYVMECIELLFVSYFQSINDVRCAEDAYKIFQFITKQENKIWRNIL